MCVAHPEFLEWESLEELYLNGNPIEELPEGKIEVFLIWNLSKIIFNVNLLEKIFSPLETFFLYRICSKFTYRTW